MLAMSSGASMACRYETMVAMAENTTGTDTPKTVNVPERVGLEGLEEKFSARWENNRVYAFNPDTTREQVVWIDKAAPTACGAVHEWPGVDDTQADGVARDHAAGGHEED